MLSTGHGLEFLDAVETPGKSGHSALVQAGTIDSRAVDLRILEVVGESRS